MALAQKLKPGQQDPEARFNLATTGFFAQNSENQKAGVPLLTDLDRGDMVRDVEAFYQFASAHAQHQRIERGEHFRRWNAEASRAARLRTLSWIMRLVGRSVGWLRRLLDWFRFRLPWARGVGGRTSGKIHESECPRGAMDTSFLALPRANNMGEARKMLETHDGTKVEFVLLKAPEARVFEYCADRPRPTYRIGPALEQGAVALAGCSCAVAHTFSVRCLRGLKAGLSTDAALAAQLADDMAASMYRIADMDPDALVESAKAAPLSLAEIATISKFKRKYGVLSVENWVEPVLGQAQSNVIQKRELSYQDTRGRIVINADAKNAAQAMGPHQSIMCVLKHTVRHPTDSLAMGPASLITCGLSLNQVRSRFQLAAEAGYFHAYLSDASAYEATQTKVFMDCSDRVIAAGARLVERVHPSEDVKLQNRLALATRAQSRIHTMKSSDRFNLGVKGFEVAALGYFITGSPWTTVGNTSGMTMVARDCLRLSEIDTGEAGANLTSIAGDDLCSLFLSPGQRDAMSRHMESHAARLGQIFKNHVADIRASPSEVVYNQKHVVYHDGVIHMFQNPARMLRRLGRVVNPLCSDPSYLDGHAVAYLHSFCSEYDGNPLIWAWVNAGLLHYKTVKPIFNQEFSYWYGLNRIGRPMSIAEARSHAVRTSGSCTPPTPEARAAYEHAFEISVERQLEVETLLAATWHAADWSIPNSALADILTEPDDDPDVSSLGMC